MMMSRAVGAWVLLALVGAGTLFLSLNSAAAATTRTWTGLGASNNWSDAANWDTGVPLAGDSIAFPASANRKTNTNNLAANTSFASIDFTGSGYEIGGNALELTGVLLNNPLNGSNSVNLDIVNDGGIQQLSGRLVLAGENTFDGDVDVEGGVLLVTSDTALGAIAAPTRVTDPATLQFAGGVDTGAEIIFIEGFGVDDLGALQSTSNTNRAGIVRLTDDAFIGVGNSTLIVGALGQASAGSKLTLVGGGKLQVESSTYTGALDVAHGNLTWNASSQAFVDVLSPGWLRGTGMVSDAEVFGGLIWPGSGNQPGILNVFGETNFNAGVFKVDIDGPAPGSGYGRLVTGSLEIDPAASFVDVELTYPPLAGQVFLVIANGSGPVDGTFTALPEGSTFVDDGYVFRISYIGGDGNDVTLTALRAVTADLRLSAVAVPSPAQAGNLLVYTVTLTNDGPDAASSPRVSMGTPDGTTYESVSGPANWSCSKPSPSPSVSCSGPAFNSGATATFTFTFRVVQGRTAAISGTAGVSSETSDPASANNAVTLSTPVGAGGAFPFKRYLAGIAADR